MLDTPNRRVFIELKYLNTHYWYFQCRYGEIILCETAQATAHDALAVIAEALDRANATPIKSPS